VRELYLIQLARPAREPCQQVKAAGRI